MVLFGLERLGETADYLLVVKALPSERLVHDFHVTSEIRS